MANERRLIDIAPYERMSDAFACKVQTMRNVNNVYQFADVLTADIPTVDAVEVVRCENCKHGPVDDETGRRYCNNPLGTYGCVPVKDDDFCSYGKRRCEDE